MCRRKNRRGVLYGINCALLRHQTAQSFIRFSERNYFDPSHLSLPSCKRFSESAFTIPGTCQRKTASAEYRLQCQMYALSYGRYEKRHRTKRCFENTERQRGRRVDWRTILYRKTVEGG